MKNVPVAMTKWMTGLVALEHINLRTADTADIMNLLDAMAEVECIYSVNGGLWLRCDLFH